MFYGSECGLYQLIVNINLRRMWIILFWDEVIYRFHDIQLIDGVYEFSYVLSDFLPVESVHFWECCWSPQIWQWICLFLLAIVFVSAYYSLTVFRHSHKKKMYSWRTDSFYHYVMPFFIPDNFTWLEIYCLKLT